MMIMWNGTYIHTILIPSLFSSLFNIGINYLNFYINISYCLYIALLFGSLLCFQLQHFCKINDLFYIPVITCEYESRT